jgi:hypothetical protein
MVSDSVAHVVNVIDSAGVVVVLLRVNEAFIPCVNACDQLQCTTTDGAAVITISSPLLATSSARLSAMVSTH